MTENLTVQEAKLLETLLTVELIRLRLFSENYQTLEPELITLESIQRKLHEFLGDISKRHA